ncbi:MAG: CDP-diacylglycerol--serine O-phosphatidyltransferase [Balneolales bacterium]|nr:CDP-diacylglycerol--serine O-phosphatidyltransferase [Balneolales bacterium]
MKYPIQRQYNNFRKRRAEVRKGKPPVNKRIAVPSFFTLMNLFSGFLAIIAIAEGDLFRGAWLIMAAGLFDVFDGMMARLANAQSEFGIELDSLSDMVSFGVAPGFLIYNFALAELGTLGILVSALPPLCGAVRLARFNVNARLEPKADSFTGLPIPSIAIVIVAFFLTFRDDLYLFDFFKGGVTSVLIPLVVIISFLMVSTIQFEKIPRFDKESIQHRKGTFFLFLMYLIIIILFREYGLMAVIVIYIAKAVIKSGYSFFSEGYSGEENEFQDYN